jgi:hypothetical protein
MQSGALEYTPRHPEKSVLYQIVAEHFSAGALGKKITSD